MLRPGGKIPTPPRENVKGRSDEMVELTLRIRIPKDIRDDPDYMSMCLKEVVRNLSRAFKLPDGTPHRWTVTDPLTPPSGSDKV